MGRSWLRINEQAPQILRDLVSGKPTHESAIYTRAFRSDGILYSAWVEIPTSETSNETIMRIAYRQNRMFLDLLLDEETPITPSSLDTFKGCDGWVEIVSG